MFKNLDVQGLGISGTESQIIESALSFGFKGIDLNMIEFAAAAKEQGLAKARRLLDSARLKIASFRLPIDLQADDAAFNAELGRVGELATLAKELGCERAVTTIAPANDERPYHQNFETHRQRLGELAKKLEPAGVRLGVGIDAAAERREGRAFQFMASYDALQMLLGMVQASNLGVVLDAWDVWASGGSMETFKRFAPSTIVSVRLSDTTESKEAGQWSSKSRTLPGVSGVIDSSAILGLLVDVGYDGPVTPLADNSQLPRGGREQVAKAAGHALDTAWKAAGLTPAGKRAPAARS
ncbi:MAG TPA: TIM barrel protein [Pirellulales bacterium]|jgi:sugar phosphate isomerase/epimerase|nr:TIM barrel protein [Pirellulales bacterium]